jgi:dTDP-4-dehydrorhamnose reductase
MLDADAPKLRVLVVGSGYVAQHLIAHLKDDFDVAYSHRRQAPPFAVPGVQAVYLDLADDDAVATALHETLPDVVVNCAAVSSPKQCDGCELPARVPGGAARVCPRYPTDSLLDGFGVAR